MVHAAVPGKIRHRTVQPRASAVPCARSSDRSLRRRTGRKTSSAPDTGMRVFSAHDFVWRERERPYDLVVYQLGNAPLPRLHVGVPRPLSGPRGAARRTTASRARAHAAAAVAVRGRTTTGANSGSTIPTPTRIVAELGVVGLLGSLTYLWPMLRIVVDVQPACCSSTTNGWPTDSRDASRSVHRSSSRWVCREPRTAPRRATQDSSAARHCRRRRRVHGVRQGDAGEAHPRGDPRAGVDCRRRFRDAHLLLAGEAVDYYDMASEARSLGIDDRVTIAGYVTTRRSTTTWRRRTCVCACDGRPRARRRRRGCDAWPPGSRRSRPTSCTRWTIPTLDPRNWSACSVRAGQHGRCARGRLA